MFHHDFEGDLSYSSKILASQWQFFYNKWSISTFEEKRQVEFFEGKGVCNYVKELASKISCACDEPKLGWIPVI